MSGWVTGQEHDNSIDFPGQSHVEQNGVSTRCTLSVHAGYGAPSERIVLLSPSADLYTVNGWDGSDLALIKC